MGVPRGRGPADVLAGHGDPRGEQRQPGVAAEPGHPAELRVEGAKFTVPDRDVPGDVRPRRPEDRHTDHEQEVLQEVRRPGAQGAETVPGGRCVDVRLEEQHAHRAV